MSAPDQRIAFRRRARVCACGHTSYWHSHGGAGSCEHNADCYCQRFDEPFDSRVRFNQLDEDAARALAYDGGRYPQGENFRLLRLALAEIDCLREDLKRAVGTL